MGRWGWLIVGWFAAWSAGVLAQGIEGVVMPGKLIQGHAKLEEKCENCLYYLEPTADISYCWHQKLRILVGADWWCQWWEKIPE